MYPALAAVYQLLGAAAIFVSLVGTWLAARHRSGWLLCVASSTMWFPALVTGNQWAAVANCVLSIAVCARNFQAQAARASEIAQLDVRVGPDPDRVAAL
jgi:hypothetical protein